MTKRFAGEIGKNYDLFNRALPWYEEEQKLIQVPLRKFSGSKRVRILEVGSGTGVTSQKIMEACPNALLFSVDNEKAMTSQYKLKMHPYLRADRAIVVCADGLQYIRKANKNFFDAFVSAQTLHNFEQEYRLSFLKELYRVLKDGALFINWDKYALDNRRLHELDVQRRIAEFNEKFDAFKRPDLAKYWIEHTLEDCHESRIMREGEAIKQMTKIGFRYVKVVYRRELEAMVTAIK